MAIDEIGFELLEIKSLIKASQEKKVPEVYINGSEVMRLLGISRPTLIQYVKDKIIAETSKNEDNRYLLSEILYIQVTHYKNLSTAEVHKLIQKKNKEFNPKSGIF